MKLKSLSRFFNRYTSLLSVILFTLFMIIVLPNESAQSASLGLDQSPDTSFFYTRETLYDIAESYGEEGRAFYIEQRFTFDLIWPLVYGIFLSVTITTLYLYIKPSHIHQKIFFLPIIAVLFDYIENIFASIVMYRYPKETIIIDVLAGPITSIKWITLSLSFILLCYFIFLWIYKITKHKKI